MATLPRCASALLSLFVLGCSPSADELRRHCFSVCDRATTVCDAVQPHGCTGLCAFTDAALRCANLIDAAWSCQDALSDAAFCATSPACESQEAAAYTCSAPPDAGSDGGRH